MELLFSCCRGEGCLGSAGAWKLAARSAEWTQACKLLSLLPSDRGLGTHIAIQVNMSCVFCTAIAAGWAGRACAARCSSAAGEMDGGGESGHSGVAVQLLELVSKRLIWSCTVLQIGQCHEA